MAIRLLFTRSDGKWTWHLEADNGQIIAVDGNQGYDNVQDARDIADRILAGEFRDAEKRIKSPKKA